MPENKRKKIKKLILPGNGDEKGMVAFGGKSGRDSKIIFKALEKGRNEHLTMVFDNNGNLDVHKTIEGKIKSYIPLAKGSLDIENLIKDLISVFKKKLISVDPKDSNFKNYIILIPKSREKLKEFYYKYYVNGEKLIIPNAHKAEIISKSMPQYFFIDYFPEITKYHFSFAFVFDPEIDELDYLIKINNEIFMEVMKEQDFEELFQRYMQFNEKLT